MFNTMFNDVLGRSIFMLPPDCVLLLNLRTLHVSEIVDEVRNHRLALQNLTMNRDMLDFFQSKALPPQI